MCVYYIMYIYMYLYFLWKVQSPKDHLFLGPNSTEWRCAASKPDSGHGLWMSSMEVMMETVSWYWKQGYSMDRFNENVQEKRYVILFRKNHGFRFRFSLKPILWAMSGNFFWNISTQSTLDHESWCEPQGEAWWLPREPSMDDRTSIGWTFGKSNSCSHTISA